MKGASVNALRNAALAVLDKLDAMLKGEPARTIGYGAAGVIMLVVYLANMRGITRLGANLSFDDAIALAFGAVGFVAIVVESIRRFVYSPQTYIEDLADESKASHEAAHLEEEFQRMMDAATSAQKKRTVAVGTAKPAGSKTDAAN